MQNVNQHGSHAAVKSFCAEFDVNEKIILRLYYKLAKHPNLRTCRISINEPSWGDLEVKANLFGDTAKVLDRIMLRYANMATIDADQRSERASARAMQLYEQIELDIDRPGLFRGVKLVFGEGAHPLLEGRCLPIGEYVMTGSFEVPRNQGSKFRYPLLASLKLYGGIKT